jgi:hypothetical protein
MSRAEADRRFRKRFRKPSEADVRRFRAIAAIMHERRCSPQQAHEIQLQQEHEERQAKVDRFFAEVAETARAFEEISNRLPQHKREAFLDLPLGPAVGLAVRHFAPRRCERRPRVLAVRRCRAPRPTRASPSDPDDPEPAGSGAPAGITRRDHTRVLEGVPV